MVLKEILLFFCTGSTVAKQWKDGRALDTVIEKANESDNKEWSYISWMTDRQAYYMDNEAHMQHSYAMEHYLCEQIKKAPGQLEDIFMQAIPLEHIRCPIHTKQSSKSV